MGTPASVLAYQEAYVELLKAWEAVPEDWRIILIAPPVVEDQAVNAKVARLEAAEKAAMAERVRRSDALQRQGLMSRHIKNPHAMRILDEQQRSRPLGVVFRIYGAYPLYLVMRLLGMKRRYWQIHRRLYMALHHGESQS